MALDLFVLSYKREYMYSFLCGILTIGQGRRITCSPLLAQIAHSRDLIFVILCVLTDADSRLSPSYHTSLVYRIYYSISEVFSLV